MSVINLIESRIVLMKNNFETIPSDRKQLLERFAEYISKKLKLGKEVNLIFICTHNSRRSHISQIWAQAAAEYYKIPNVKCYSGGTEATAFNPRALKAMQKVGFIITKQNDSDNPIYLVNYSAEKEPLKCFSKVYSDEFNPQKDFAAVMTCSDADENCPIVIGAEARFSVGYEDPKIFDDTELEIEKYDERVNQIGLEMSYLFNLVIK